MKKINIAFAHIPNNGWSAGEYYLKNIFIALKLLDEPKRPTITLLVQGELGERGFQSFIDNVLVRPPYIQDSFFLRQFLKIAEYLNVKINKKNQVSAFLRDSGVDALFTIGELGDNFSLPLLSWIPDFQHRHFPEYFSEKEIAHRERSFARSVRHSKRIIVSSQSSFEDLRLFDPGALSKARVLPFVAQIPENIYGKSPESICSKYNIPEKYIFLPNQFWKHKNHKLVVEALAKAKAKCPILTIVCTGHTVDERDIGFFGDLLGMISKAGVREQLILLGLVPRDDMFALMRQSVAVLQPSLFEGWSTTVEEVKSLGKTLIISDIPVHREQNAPHAHYFNPNDPEGLASCLLDNYVKLRSGPDMEMEETARRSLTDRTVDFGRKFIQIVEEVV